VGDLSFKHGNAVRLCVYLKCAVELEKTAGNRSHRSVTPRGH